MDAEDLVDRMSELQQAVSKGEADLDRGQLIHNLHVHIDYSDDEPQLTYVRLEGKTITSLVIVTKTTPYEGLPCFSICYAIPEAYRRQGRAIEAVTASLAELQHDLSRTPLGVFYVEALVDLDDEPAKRVANATISTSPTRVIDPSSKRSALRYLRRITHVPISSH